MLSAIFKTCIGTRLFPIIQIILTSAVRVWHSRILLRRSDRQTILYIICISCIFCIVCIFRLFILFIIFIIIIIFSLFSIFSLFIIFVYVIILYKYLLYLP